MTPAGPDHAGVGWQGPDPAGPWTDPPPADSPVPEIVEERAGPDGARLLWRNELGGLTFRLGAECVKWNPRGNGIDLDRERVRLEWLTGRHPAPRIIAWGADDDAQWLATSAMPGQHAVGDTWRARRPEAVRAIAAGLGALHSIAIDDVPPSWRFDSWVSRTPPSIGPRPRLDDPVLVHGDACAPNTLIESDGSWTGNVDFGASQSATGGPTWRSRR